jgi:hypothetical protein
LLTGPLLALNFVPEPMFWTPSGIDCAGGGCQTRRQGAVWAASTLAAAPRRKLQPHPAASERTMTDSFLIGVDGSKSSHRAADFAAAHARAAGARVVVAYVIEWSPFSFNTPEENEQRHRRREEELERAHAQVLDPLVNQLKTAGLEVEGVVRHGHAADVLAGLAK